MSLDQRFEELAGLHLREPASIETLQSIQERRVRRRRMRTASVALLLVLGGVVAIGLTTRSDDRRTIDAVGATDPTTRASTTPTEVPPSTVLDPTKGIKVPFTADDGALTVAVGDPPVSVSQEQAIALLSSLVPRIKGFPLDLAYAVVSGRVTLAPGLGVPPMTDEAAWVISHTESTGASCGARALGAPEAPTTSSKLSVAIITGPTLSDVVMYEGAGTWLCAPRLSPEAISGISFNLQVMRP